MAPRQQFEFRAGESVRNGVRRLSAFLAKEARALCVRTASEKSDRIHAARLILKRQRALLRVLRPSLGKEFVRRQDAKLRSAAHRLASTRDATAGTRTLVTLEKETRGDQAAAVRKAREQFNATIHDQILSSEEVRRALHRAADALDKAGLDLTKVNWRRRGWSALGAGLEESYRRARRRFRAAHTTGEEAAFHSWRTATKSLMYQLCLIRAAEPRRSGQLIRRLDELQKLLGAEHDLSVLASRLTNSRQKKNGEAVTSTLEAIAARQQRLRKKALKEGRHLFGDRPSEFIGRRHREWKKWRKK